ncbi:MAG: 2-C-methyl-D-erythritol 4-phosphate cytidylyltransferase [Bacteroidales bacterium]|nr:2-C-methyl-D-erythritol 4-phosphate cytidylyltransferase [Bacteroidales bacterium]
MKTYAIILAGGIGSRMETVIPKQFIPIAGKPVIMHTIQTFRDYDPKLEIIIALPDAHVSLWKDLCSEFKFDIEHQIVRGGKERFFSVKNALERVPNDAIVLIHDGVRPLVSIKTIDRVREKTIDKGNAIPYIPSPDSLRVLNDNGSKAVDRSKYIRIQTPQGFLAKDIKEAYNGEYKSTFTDDASVLESLGKTIELVLGNNRNIKITQPIDLVIAESLIEE